MITNLDSRSRDIPKNKPDAYALHRDRVRESGIKPLELKKKHQPENFGHSNVMPRNSNRFVHAYCM